MGSSERQVPVSDNVWLAIVGLIAVVVKDYLDGRRASEAAARVKEVATAAAESAKQVAEKADLVVKQAEAVKVTLATVTAASAVAATATDARLTGIAQTTDTLEKQGNSRWAELEAKLQRALDKIDTLQQQRVDDAKGRPAELPP